MLNTLFLEPETRVDNSPQLGVPANLGPLYVMLLSALDMGWTVEEPVDLRPRWNEVQPRLYHFLLRPPRQLGSQAKRLITVQESPEVQRFIERMGWRTYEIC